MGLGVNNTAFLIYRFTVHPKTFPPKNPNRINDEHSEQILKDAHSLGLTSIRQIHQEDLYFIEGNLSSNDLEILAASLLCDPVAQTIEWTCLQEEVNTIKPAHGVHVIEVGLRPGVSDPVAEQIVRAAEEIGVKGIHQASTAQRFLIQGDHLEHETLLLLANRLLSNPVIQCFAIGEIEPAFIRDIGASTHVEIISIREMDEIQLLEISTVRRAALDLAELLAVRSYFRSEKRDMTDVEFETIAQTWSEHCVHKTFKARIDILNPGSGSLAGEQPETQIDNLLKTYLKTATDQIHAPWVLSAFVDNAGILEFDQDFEVSFKVETHNHPSAIEPFGGANTGIGGVIRDVIGVSAKPVAATDVLCFGPQDTLFTDLPEGVYHPRRIQSGVVSGVQDYGNKIGIPTVSGAVLYDAGFTSNPLVFCGCVGLAPLGSHPRNPHPGDRVILLGGRTGRDGLRGATFSSMTMDAQTGEVAGASVQIGAPITEKGLIDVILLARDEKLYTAITDCGAGGLSSAAGEMASQLGANINLQDVQLKYPGLAPWEIWLSEAQERMVLAVPAENLRRLAEICQRYGIELTDIGVFEDSGRLIVDYGDRRVLDLSNEFLHNGIPQRRLRAELPSYSLTPTPFPDQVDIPRTLQKLLAHPNIASKEKVIRLYDHEVQGGTVIKPLTGAENDGPSDGVVIKPIGTLGKTAIVLANGINPEYGKLNPYRMAWSVIDEAVRNGVAAGGDPDRIALLDNFCWGDPLNPKTLGSLVDCARGCYDAAITYQTPFISGKDSLNNEYFGKDGFRHAIPPTLLISSIGFLDDLSKAVSMDLKKPGNLIYLVGSHQPKLAGSHMFLVLGIPSDRADTPDRPENAMAVYRALHQAMSAGLIRSCHDLSEGGLAVTASEMCIAGRLGLEITLPANLNDPPPLFLFGESNGCLLVEVSPTDKDTFETFFQELPMILIGRVSSEPQLKITQPEGQTQTPLLLLPIQKLVTAWQATL